MASLVKLIFVIVYIENPLFQYSLSELHQLNKSNWFLLGLLNFISPQNLVLGFWSFVQTQKKKYFSE